MVAAAGARSGQTVLVIDELPGREVVAMANPDQGLRDMRGLLSEGATGVTASELLMGSEHRTPTPSRPAGRGGGVHVLYFLVALALWFAVCIGLSVVIERGATEDLYLSDQAHDAAATRAMVLAMAASSAYAVVTIGLIAGRVGYRLRDGFFAIVPFYCWFFVPKMLWRWTGLPDRYWRSEEPHSAETDDLLPTTTRRPMALIGGLVVVLTLAAALGVYVSLRADDGSGPQGWVTTRARGMSISLPRSFHVFTDPGDYADGLAEVGLADTDELAEMLEQFPDFFALAAFEVPDEEIGVRASVVVTRLPSTDEQLDESAELFTEGVEEDGLYEVTATKQIDVGTGRYAAVRIDARGHLPGGPRERSVAYVVDGGSQLWIVTWSALYNEYDTVSPTFDQSIASLTLPSGDAR